MIIFRYLAREIYTGVLAVTVVLVLVFLSNQLVHYLSYAAIGKISASILLRLTLLQLSYLLGLLLPISLFFGIMLALGRWYVDNEMAVLFASGLSHLKLVSMVLQIAGFVIVLIAVLTLVVNPKIAAKKGELISVNSPDNSLLETILPGRFMATEDNKRVVYVEDVARSRQRAKNLFMAEKSEDKNNGNWTVIAASTGYQTEDLSSGDRFIVAENGYRYQGTPGENNFLVVKFEKYGIKIDNNSRPVAVARLQNDAKSTRSLIKSTLPSDVAELQWRLSIPLVALILAILGVPLSRVKPRQGRFIQLVPALLICLIYVNLLFVAREWLERSLSPLWLGLWWVHGIFLLLAILLFGFWQKKPRQSKRMTL